MPKIIDNVDSMILDSAKRILLEGNYHDFSMRNVAKDCGIGVGTIYNYYPGKMVLIARVMEKDWEIAKREMDDSLEKAQSITGGITGIYHAIKGFAGIYYSVWAEYAEGNETNDILRKYHPTLQRQISNKIDLLLERFGHAEDKKLSPVLAESVLAAATKAQISIEQVELLGKRLFE